MPIRHAKPENRSSMLVRSWHCGLACRSRIREPRFTVERCWPKPNTRVTRNLHEPNQRSPPASLTQFDSFGLAALPLVARVLGLGLDECLFAADACLFIFEAIRG